jgi:hypothetical protein
MGLTEEQRLREQDFSQSVLLHVLYALLLHIFSKLSVEIKIVTKNFDIGTSFTYMHPLQHGTPILKHVSFQSIC